MALLSAFLMLFMVNGLVAYAWVTEVNNEYGGRVYITTTYALCNNQLEVKVNGQPYKIYADPFKVLELKKGINKVENFFVQWFSFYGLETLETLPNKILAPPFALFGAGIDMSVNLGVLLVFDSNKIDQIHEWGGLIQLNKLSTGISTPADPENNQLYVGIRIPKEGHPVSLYKIKQERKFIHLNLRGCELGISGNIPLQYVKM